MDWIHVYLYNTALCWCILVWPKKVLLSKLLIIPLPALK